jgi:hypothetical protein
VVAGLEDDDVVVGDVVNETVRVIDAAGPGTGEDVPERLRFADTRERIAQRVGDQLVDAPFFIALITIGSVVVLLDATSPLAFRHEAAHPRSTRCRAQSKSRGAQQEHRGTRKQHGDLRAEARLLERSAVAHG